MVVVVVGCVKGCSMEGAFGSPDVFVVGPYAIHWQALAACWLFARLVASLLDLSMWYPKSVVLCLIVAGLVLVRVCALPITVVERKRRVSVFWNCCEMSLAQPGTPTPHYALSFVV